MLLRNSISNTKKLFQKTLVNLKCFFSKGYQKLPKIPPYNNHFFKDMDFSNYDHHQEESQQKITKIKREPLNGSPIIRKRGLYASSSKRVREEGRCLVARKLKELEKLDKSNVNHVLDIEEVFHYYSRLTCPAYVEMVDRFFTEIYIESFDLSSSGTKIFHGDMGKNW